MKTEQNNEGSFLEYSINEISIIYQRKNVGKQINSPNVAYEYLLPIFTPYIDHREIFVALYWPLNRPE